MVSGGFPSNNTLWSGDGAGFDFDCGARPGQFVAGQKGANAKRGGQRVVAAPRGSPGGFAIRIRRVGGV